MIDKTVCELFAGVGGFRIGLENADETWNTVWANQWEPGKKSQYAFDCYTTHFGNKKEYVNEDITSIDKKKIPSHNLLVGGFPCQDYSVARTGAKGMEGKKGVLWWQIREILESKKPKFVLLENVDRLLKSPVKQRGRDFGVILACFNDLGYTVEWRVINAADYGFAQRRKRTFIYACKNTTDYFRNIKKEELKDVIHKKGFFIKQFNIENNTLGKEYKFEYKDIYDVSDNFKLDFKNSGIMSKGKIYTEETIPIYEVPTPLRKIMQVYVDEKYCLTKNLEKWEYLKGPKDILRTSKEGYSYHYREGRSCLP